MEIPPGTIFALLGENGAGKTTALRDLTRTARAVGGAGAGLGDDPQADGLAVRRRVGYLPEQPALYDWMTVGELGWFASGFYDGSRFSGELSPPGGRIGRAAGRKS